MRARLLGLLWIVYVAPLAAAEPAELYFLTVGVGSYAQAPPDRTSDRLRSFAQTPNGPWSAYRLAYALVGLGAVRGIELSGMQHSLVRRQDVFTALDELIATARLGSNPFILYYFNGHGIGEGLGWNLFAVPGDFVGPWPAEDLSVLTDKTLYAAEVVDRLNDSGIPYLAIFDHCYEGEEQSFEAGALSQEAAQNLNDVLAVMRYMNQFHTDSPVLFSASPGTVVSAVADPHPDFGDRSVGPLARRLLLAIAAHEETGTDLDGLVSALTDAAGQTLDPVTQPAITFVEKPLPGINFAAREKAPTIERRQGSGREPNLAPAARPVAPEAHASPIPKRIRLLVEGSADDFVTEGRRYDLTLTAQNIDYFEYEPDHSISMMFQQNELLGTFDLEIPPDPAGAAGRHTFGRAGTLDGEWGFELSLDGRGCNEITGVLEIEQLPAQGGEPREFALNFEQVCDHRGVSRGRMEIAW